MEWKRKPGVKLSRRNVNQETGKKVSNKFTMKMQKKLVMLFIIVLLAFVGLSARLIMITKSNEDQYKKQVLSQQQYTSITLPYKRGDILDAKGTKLAVSEKVYNLVIDCKNLLAKEEYLEPTLAALTKCFSVNEKDLRAYITANPGSQYYVVAKKLSYEEISDFVALQNDTKKNPNIKGVWFEEEYRRLYPNDSLASDVIGFTGTDNVGSYGLEEYYNDILNGTTGREYGYLNDDSNLERTTIAATDGYNLVSTIDANIQGIVEKNLAAFNAEHKDEYREGNGSKNSACIIMDVNTGEVLAMASYPGFNLNDTRNTESLIGLDMVDVSGNTIKPEVIINKDNIGELEKNQDQLFQNLNAVWKNYCISSTFEPGSTAKPFTVASGLESGKITGNETYVCNGMLHVGDYDIYCHNTAGDGVLTVKQAIEKSCNVALMQIGQAIGKSTFLEYQEKFNFGLKTNIDLAGEARTDSLMFTDNNMGVTELATSTFGQGFNVSMIQMVAGFCSLVNGGYYYEPHMVSQITTSDGSIVQNIDPRVLKQTISASTSATIRDYCNGVVIEGTGKTARPAGYAIGGKTGTAERLPRNKIDYTVSFMGYAPADNPQIAIYVVVDRPNVWIQDDAKYATKIVRSILTEVLPYLNIFMTEELSDEERLELEAQQLAITSVSGNETTSGNSTISENGTTAEQQPAETVEKEGDQSDKTATPVEAVPPPEGDYDTAPATGVLLDPNTGEAVKSE